MFWSACELTSQHSKGVHVQGEHSDMMYIVESGVVTCHMDFLRLQHRMQLPAVSKEILAVAPVRFACLLPV